MKTILVVDDNEPNRDGLARRLARRGYGIELAADGMEAITVAHATMPDLILMDLGLPGIDGSEATHLLKAHGSTRHIPIIVLTAHATTDHRTEALGSGADDFDTKPVRFEQLLQKVESLLGRSAAA